MIKSLKADGLNGGRTFNLTFHEDINIITGRNGSGKTTLLKLLWYAISGNLERIIPEITFESFKVVTDKVLVAIEKDTNNKRQHFKLNYQIGDEDSKEIILRIGPGPRWETQLAEANRDIARASGASIFFPTFRRIEGGFSISSRPQEKLGRVLELWPMNLPDYLPPELGRLQQAMNHLSESISVGRHRLVASISTDDITRLLTSKYAEISEKNNLHHMVLSSFIQNLVGQSRQDGAANGAAEQIAAREILDEIRQRARSVTEQSEALMRPFTVLSDLVSEILQYKGIKLSGPLTLGEAQDAIMSDALSAGEKQMLSFLCYNAFASETCFFIDEPEISLHVDWQRILFPTLLKQTTANQFIVATHSPFIYSMYADKELLLAPDRGDQYADPQHDGAGDYRLSGEDEPAHLTRRG